MPVLPLSRTHTDAVITALEAIGVPVGDVETPANAGNRYYIVEPMPSNLDHPLVGDHRWALFVYHVKCVAISREGAEWLRDKAREVLLAENLTVVNRDVIDVTIETTTPVVRDDDLRTEPVFWVADRYRIDTDPA